MHFYWRIKVAVAVLVVSSLPAGLCQYPQGYGPVSSNYHQNYPVYPTGPEGEMSPQNYMVYGYHQPAGGMKSTHEDPMTTDLAMKSAMAPLNTVVSSVAVPPRPITSVLGVLQPKSVLQLQKSTGAVDQPEDKKSNCTKGCGAARSLYADNDTSTDEGLPPGGELPESGVQCHCWTFGLFPIFPPKSPKYPPLEPQYPPQPPQPIQYPPEPPQTQFARSNGFFYLPMAHGVRQSYVPQYRPQYPTRYRPYISRPMYPYGYYHHKPQGDFYYNRI